MLTKISASQWKIRSWRLSDVLKLKSEPIKLYKRMLVVRGVQNLFFVWKPWYTCIRISNKKITAMKIYNFFIFLFYNAIIAKLARNALAKKNCQLESFINKITFNSIHFTKLMICYCLTCFYNILIFHVNP